MTMAIMASIRKSILSAYQYDNIAVIAVVVDKRPTNLVDGVTCEPN